MTKNTTNAGATDWGAVHRVRVGHVRKLLLHRYGPELPDDDAGDEDLRILLHVKANACKPVHRVKGLLKEIGLQAPWMSTEKANKIAAEISAKPLKVTADWLGQTLNVDIATREALGIWQIGAVGQDAAARAERNRERRRERNRKRMAVKRQQEGRQSRSAWLEQNSASRTKPWEALGISRRTYYRRRTKADGTGVCTVPVVAAADKAQTPHQRSVMFSPGGTGLCPMAREVLGDTHLCHPRTEQGAHTSAAHQTGG